ncbi:hypothetical protein EU538_09180 [Candidatus Thorarchaeota archaeon]|nr:MAG: hypothetical protein EU538_09180 [Candidatus Thorarchaeota archaeon]
MNSEAEQVIETYLALVGQNLPDSIMDEVISEIRDYLIESATDLADGEMTVASAKKAVARFGAPSEVAEEYRDSMILEEEAPAIGREALPAGSEGIEAQYIDQDIEEGDVNRRFVAIGLAFAQYVLDILIWSGLVLILSAGFVPSFFFANLLPVTGAIVALIVYFERSKKNLARFVDTDSSTWPFYRRMFSLPRPVPAPTESWNMQFSLYGSFAGAMMYLILSITNLRLSPIALFMGFLLLVRAVLVETGLLGYSSTGQARYSLIYDLVCLSVMNWALLTFVYNAWSGAFIAWLLIGFDVAFGGYLLFDISVNTERLWTDRTYSQSVVPEPEEQVPTAEEEKTEIAQEQLEEPTEEKPSEADTSPYFEALGKGVGLIFLWSSILVIVSTAIVQSMGIYVLPVGLWLTAPLAAAILFARIVYLRLEERIFERQPHPDWSPLQSALTFPEECSLQPKGYFLLSDGVVSAGFGLALGLVSFFGPYATHSKILSFLIAVLCLARLKYVRGRLAGSDPALFAKAEFGLILLTLGISNIAFSLPFTTIDLFYASSLNPLLLLYFGVSSPYLLYLLVAYGQDLWWEVQEIRPPAQDAEPSTEHKRHRKPAKTLRNIQWSIVMRLAAFVFGAAGLVSSLMIWYTSIVGWPPLPHWYYLSTGNLILGTSLIALIFSCLAAVVGGCYITVRRAYVRRRPDAGPIGKRSRIEAGIDFIPSILFGMMCTTLILTEMTSWDNLTLGYGLTRPVFLVFTAIALYVRLAGNADNIMFGDGQRSSQLILNSSRALLLVFGIILGQTTVQFSAGVYPLSSPMVLLSYGAVLFLAFQVAVTKHKFADEKLQDGEAPTDVTETAEQLDLDKEEGPLGRLYRNRDTTVVAMLMPYAFFYIFYLTLIPIAQMDILFAMDTNWILTFTFLVFGLMTLSVIFGVLYFKYRKVMVMSGEDTTPLGKRGQASAGADIIISLAFLGLMTIMIWANPVPYPQELVVLLQVLVLGGMGCLAIGVLGKVIGDSHNILHGDNVRSQVAASFGSLFVVIGLLLLAMALIPLDEDSLSPTGFVSLLLLLIIPASFQSITNWLRLHEKIPSNTRALVASRKEMRAQGSQNSGIPVNY